MATTEVYVGVDLGTSYSKAAAFDESGHVLHSAGVPTEWTEPVPGFTQRSVCTVQSQVDDLFRSLLQDHRLQVRGIGFTGMAESGVMLEPDGTSRHEMIAWFDPRGAEEADELSDDRGEEFIRHTGQRVSQSASIFKLLWLRNQGIELRGAQWLTLAEYVVHYLGAPRRAERSLAARTGLLNIHTEELYPDSLDLLGVDDDFLPPVSPAGTPFGQVRDDYPLSDVRGAVLTVAGHDHLVAAAAAGAAAPGDVFDSMGTAEAFVAAVDHVPDPDRVSDLVSLGFTISPHVVRNTACLLGGTRAGLVLNRIRNMLGADADAAMAQLEAASEMAQPTQQTVRVDGVATTDKEVCITLLTDDVTPGDVWAAALETSTRHAEALLRVLADLGLPSGDMVVSGGWSRFPSVARAHAARGGAVRFTRDSQPGLAGATLLARWAHEHSAEEQGPSGEWFKSFAQPHEEIER